jgi:hypothetical protein
MNDRQPFWIPTELDIDGLKDTEQRERVSNLIIEVNDGKLTLTALWQRWSASIKGDKILNDDYRDIPLVIASIFHIPFAEDINDSIEKLLDKFDNLEAKFRNHRHETGKTFSAKPEY